ncbi:MAG TPA: hypothetical protein VK607_08285, partial [Kofleriaceae bacterium]|nr:hypothetical protein [Kofleriaceae bacterium]
MGYEVPFYRARYGVAKKPRSYFVQGAALAMMLLAETVKWTERPQLTNAYYIELFRGKPRYRLVAEYEPRKRLVLQVPGRSRIESTRIAGRGLASARSPGRSVRCGRPERGAAAERLADELLQRGVRPHVGARLRHRNVRFALLVSGRRQCGAGVRVSGRCHCEAVSAAAPLAYLRASAPSPPDRLAIPARRGSRGTRIRAHRAIDDAVRFTPMKLECVRRFAADRQRARVELRVVTRAERQEVRSLIATSLGAKLHVMDVEVSRRSAAGRCAPMLVACEYVTPHARRHGRGHPSRLLGIQRADQLGIAVRPVDRAGTELDLATGAVLPAAAARFTHRHGDLVRGSLGRAA